MYGNGFQNQELAPAESEFQRQLQGLASSGRFSPQQIQQIQQIWESQKANAYATAKQTINGPLYGATLANFIQGFLKIAVNEITNVYNPMATTMGYNYGYGMPNTMMVNPYLNQGYNRQQFNVPMSPFAQSYAPMQGITNCGPVAQAMEQQSQAKYAEVPQQTQPMQPAPTEETKNHGALSKLTIQKNTFSDPKEDENDTVYGTEEHTTSIGTIKVNAMRDCDGVPFRHVIIRLNEPCRNKQEAYNRSKLIYHDLRASHIDIQYDLAITLPMEYVDGKKVFASIKKAIPRSSGAANPLKYLQNIDKVLNGEKHGVAKAINEFIMQRYNYVGPFACLNSDQRKPFFLEYLNDLIHFSDTDYEDEVINTWQARPGFMANYVKCVNSIVKKDLGECVVLDPSKLCDLKTIIRHFTGLTESDEGELLDVTMDLLPRLEEYAKASHNDKLNMFGASGKIVAETTTIILKNQHLVYTDLVPETMLLETRDHNLCIVYKPLYIGGYTDNEPNKADSNFEYMLLKSSLGSDFWVDLFIGINRSSIHSFKCIPTTDRWVAIIPSDI